MVEVRPTIPFVYYDDGGMAVTVTPQESAMVPARLADRLIEAGMAEAVEPKQAPENKSAGDAPEVKAAPVKKAPAKKAAAPKAKATPQQ